MTVNFENSPSAIASRWVHLFTRRSDAGSLMELEQEFVRAYKQRHGAPIREFARVDGGQYRINGIIFSETQVNLMLETLKEELAQRNSSLVRRLIRYFGGRHV